MRDEVEIAAVVLQPHFDAVRDTFAAFEPAPGEPLERLRRVRYVVDPGIHNTYRHFAACRDDGRQLLFAPEIVTEVDAETLVAILAHEFGHAADMAYPGDWCLLDAGTESQRAVWIAGKSDRRSEHWRGWLWARRSDDEIEWAADCIAELVTGRRIHYCGRCMLQCFTPVQGRPQRQERRPAGLR
jgi:hypothetical protein